MVEGISHLTSQVANIERPQQKTSSSQQASSLSVSFGAVMESIKSGIMKQGVMSVANKNASSEAAWNQEKLEIEKKREFKTDLEEAHDLLKKISQLIEDKEQK